MKTRQILMLEKLELYIPVFINAEAEENGDIGNVTVRSDNAVEFENLNWASIDEMQDALEISKAFVLWRTSKIRNEKLKV